MKIIFLETSLPGIRWMRRYYARNPQLNAQKAFVAYKRTQKHIASMTPPTATFEDFSDVWEAKIQSTAFSILYTLRGDNLFIIDVRDQRGYRSYIALKKYEAELREKYKL